MLGFKARECEIIVEWEGKELKVWLLSRDNPANRIELSESEIKATQTLINQMRDAKWIEYQQKLAKTMQKD